MSPSKSITSLDMDEAEHILVKCKALAQRASIFSNRLVGELDALGSEVKSLELAIRKAEKDQPGPQDDAMRIRETLSAAKSTLRGGPSKFMSKEPPLMLHLLLGDRADFVSFRSDQMIAIKVSYYRFRDRSAVIMLVVPGLLALGMARVEALRSSSPYSFGGASAFSFAPGLMTLTQIYLAWLAFFYLAMSLRENVLMVNGSHIKSWWIQHHYFSAMCCLLLLGLPVGSPSVFKFTSRFMIWSCFQAMVMLVQNGYQRRRMYTRIALGKNSLMDVASSGVESSGHLLILYPLLFALQAAQIYIGVDMALILYPSFFSGEGWVEFEGSDSDLRGMRGIFIVGTVFSYMGLRNLMATIKTIAEKRRYGKAQRMKKTRSVAELPSSGVKKAI